MTTSESTPSRSHIAGLVVRSLAIALVAIGLLLLVPAKAAGGSSATAAIQVQPKAAKAVPPGSPCGSPVWTTPVSFDPNGWPIAHTRFGMGDGLSSAAQIGGLAYPPGKAAVTITTWDGHPIRADQYQGNERVRLEFTTSNGTMATGYSTDLADGVAEATATTNVGTVDLPTGATAVRIAHAGGAGTNSLMVTAVCVNFTAAPPPTTAPPATIVPVTTVPPTTVPVTTVPPTTVPVTTVPPTTVPVTTVPPTTVPVTTVPPTTVPATTVPPATTQPPTTQPPTTAPATTVPPVSSTEAPLNPTPTTTAPPTTAPPTTAPPTTAPPTTVRVEVLGETELPRTGPNGTRRLAGLGLILLGAGLYLTGHSERSEASNARG